MKKEEEGKIENKKKVSDFVTVYNSPGFSTIVVFQSTHRKRRMRERERERKKVIIIIISQRIIHLNQNLLEEMVFPLAIFLNQ